jgi:hypothetical protein
MNQILWKKGILILIVVESFWFTIGTLIHEWTHSISFFFLSRQFGEVHILDSVAFSFHTIGVCIPPQGLVILDRTPFEGIANFTTFGITILFFVLLYKKYYCYPCLKKLKNQKCSRHIELLINIKISY